MVGMFSNAQLDTRSYYSLNTNLRGKHGKFSFYFTVKRQ